MVNGMVKTGDNVRITKWWNRGREGRVLWVREGLVKVQYGNSCWHTTVVKIENLEVVK